MIKWVLISSFILSCSSRPQNQYINIINKTDKLQVVYSSDIYKDTTVSFSPELKESFKKVFKSKEIHCSCKTTGRLRFYSNNVVMLVADFSLHEMEDVSGKHCEFIFLESSEGGCFQLNYNVGMYLGEYLMKKDE